MAKCLLIVDPLLTNRIKLAAALSAAQYDVETVGSLFEHAEEAPDPDIIILGTNPDTLLDALNDSALATRYAKTPIFCVDSEASPDVRVKALRAGAREILGRPVQDSLLLARLRSILRENEALRECERRRVAAASFGFAEAASEFAPAIRIGCLGPRDMCLDKMRVIGSVLPHAVEYLSSQDVLRDDASRHSPDAYVIFSETSHDLENLLPELRERSHLRHASVLVLYPDGATDIATTALNLGASDIAAASSSGDEIAWRIDAMLDRKHLQDQLRTSDEQSYRAAATDPLTGLYNRRYAEAYIADTLVSARETGQNFVMMLTDIDHFKQVNDVHGHVVGDLVLCAVAERLRENVRACDLVSRHGGEEFLIVMPNTTESEARHTAERLRHAMASLPVATPNGPVPVTISVGVASGKAKAAAQERSHNNFSEPGNLRPSAFSAVLEAADTALYRAKELGRNRVEFNVA